MKGFDRQVEEDVRGVMEEKERVLEREARERRLVREAKERAKEKEREALWDLFDPREQEFWSPKKYGIEKKPNFCQSFLKKGIQDRLSPEDLSLYNLIDTIIRSSPCRRMSHKLIFKEMGSAWIPLFGSQKVMYFGEPHCRSLFKKKLKKFLFESFSSSCFLLFRRDDPCKVVCRGIPCFYS